MPIIEYQIKTDKLLTLLRNQLRQVTLCFPQPISTTLLGDVFLDHIEIPSSEGFLDKSISVGPLAGYLKRSEEKYETKIAVNNASLIPLFINKLQVVIPLQIHFKTWSNLVNNEPAIHTSGTVIELYLDFYGEMQRDGGLESWYPQVFLEFNKIDWKALDEWVPQETKNHINEAIKNLAKVSVPISMGKIGKMLKSDLPLTVFNVGVTSDFWFSRIAIRWEVNGADMTSYETWNAFHNKGEISALPPGKDWTILLPGSLLANSINQMIYEQLEKENNKSGDSKRIEVLEWPQTYWLGNGTETTFSLDITDHSKTMCPLDVGVDITITSSFSVVDDNKIQISNTVYHNVYEGDVFLCITLVGQSIPLAPIVVGIAIDVYEPNFAQYLGELPQQPIKCEWLDNEEEEAINTMICQYKVSIPPKPKYVFQGKGAVLDSIFPTPIGPLLAGTLDLKDYPVPNLTWFASNPRFSDWYFWDKCKSLMRVTSVNLAVLGRSSPKYDRLCEDPQIFDDPLGVYGPVFIDWNTGIISIIISEGLMRSVLRGPHWPGQVWNFYPCKVLIKTDHGIKYFTIPAPPPPPKPLTKEEEQEIMIQREVKCKKYIHWFWGRYFNPLWLGDPEIIEIPDSTVTEHLWDVSVVEMKSGLTFSIKDSQGLIIGTAWAHNNRIAQVTALVSPAKTGNELTIIGSSAESGRTSQTSLTPLDDTESVIDQTTINQQKADGKLVVEQTLLIHAGVVNLDNKCRYAGGEMVRGIPTLSCVTSGGVDIYDLTRPNSPKLLRRISSQGTQGIIHIWKSFVTWGENGLSIVSSDNERTRETKISSNHVIGVAKFADYLYALTTGSVEVYDQKLQCTGELNIESFTNIVSTGKCLVLGNKQGFAVFDLSQPTSPRKVIMYELGGIADLIVPQIKDNENLIFVRDIDGGGKIFDLSKSDEPREIVHYAQDPWFVVSRRIGKRLLVCVDDGGDILNIYSVANKVILNESELGRMERTSENQTKR